MSGGQRLRVIWKLRGDIPWLRVAMHYCLVFPAATKCKRSPVTVSAAASLLRGSCTRKARYFIVSRVDSCRISADFESLSIRTDVKNARSGTYPRSRSLQISAVSSELPVIRPKSAASANSFNIPRLEVYDYGMSTEIAPPLSLPILTAYFSEKKGNGSCHKK